MTGSYGHAYMTLNNDMCSKKLILGPHDKADSTLGYYYSKAIFNALLLLLYNFHRESMKPEIDLY